ncbi:protein FAR1-RELATED SEQUENCE 2-like [Nicotiana tomentosiformis]|uniref:protein FAR1-RELATED SEQUENCE 2-like n=1 Tax=Nicotiana tomentosiformis TaxID=4098 RepID=UPI00051C608A|nr:protein FAR-RED IMPAIRED RESPONSE 1-like [Nicotiana tomentosiformis]XP_009620542.1 protein FAR-RED IMPAIRED RESPONSE 1-like [Nicotiana tomentosiformis]XP_009620543.1 protein FAR-RED IMPAIRED RESPONSE 1-like [Nicotiana tomentosiformis]
MGFYKSDVAMGSPSSPAFGLDERKDFPPVESNDDHGYFDEELTTDMDMYVAEDDKCLRHSNGEQTSSDNAIEPQIGMEFNSRDDARDFYMSYGRRIGFTVRIHHNRRSRINNVVIGQDFVCSKEGFREKKYIHRKDRVLPPPPATREGCPAILRVALRESKWVVTKFVKEHNHALMSPSKVPWRGSTRKLVSQDEKDQRIRELTLELYNERQRCKRRCAAYQEQLQTLLKFIEDHTDHLSRSVEEAVQRVKELENEQLEESD